MVAMPPKDPVSSTAVQHSDGVSNTRIRRVDHHAEIPREFHVEFTTLERTSTAPRLRRPRTLEMAHPDWSTAFDFHPRAAEVTRRRMFAEWADQPMLVIGTHYAAPTAGHIRRDGEAYLFEPSWDAS